MTGGKAGPPRALPDRIFRVAKKFMVRYVDAPGIVERTMERAQEELAWVELKQHDGLDGEEPMMVMTCWYGDDRDASLAALDELAAALLSWDRSQGVRR